MKHRLVGLLSLCVVGLAFTACAKDGPKKKAKHEEQAGEEKKDPPKKKKTVAETLAGKGDAFHIPHAQLEKDDWLKRVGSFLQGGASPDACGPSLPEDVCGKAMGKAIDSLGKCPVRASIAAQVKPYDAAAKVFPAELTNTQITNDGLLWLEEDIFVKWPAAARAVAHEAGVDPCKTDKKLTEAEHSRAAVKLPVTDEAEAKEASEKLRQPAAEIDVLYILDRKSAQGPFACGTSLPKPQPVGTIVAWRVKPALGWHAVEGTDWTPPKDCKPARTFFGMGK